MKKSIHSIFRALICSGDCKWQVGVIWETRNLSTLDEWDKVWYINIMQYYSAIKTNEIMAFTDNWLEQETIMLNEVSQYQKIKSPRVSKICGY